MIPDFTLVESWGNDGNIDIIFKDKIPEKAISKLYDVTNYLINNNMINNCVFDLDRAIIKILDFWVSSYKLRYSPIVKEWVFNY